MTDVIRDCDKLSQVCAKAPTDYRDDLAGILSNIMVGLDMAAKAAAKVAANQ